MSTTANTAQREYWNTIAGPRWVGLEGFVERRVQAVNDLLLIWSGVAAGERVLEVGCGTGAFTVPLAEAVGEHGEVLGADISAGAHASALSRPGCATSHSQRPTGTVKLVRHGGLRWRTGVGSRGG